MKVEVSLLANKITVIGLGAGDIEQMPLGIYRAIKHANHVYMRTKEHPVVETLKQEGLSFESFDWMYEQGQQFADVYESIVQRLFLEVKDKKEIVYAVPGHPMVAEKTVQLLIDKAEVEDCLLEIKGGQSFLDAMFAALKIDPIEGFQMFDATDFRVREIQLQQHMIICQVYDAFIASEVKLSLMEVLPNEYEVSIVTAAGSKGEQIKTIPLYELDRQVELNNVTSVYIPPVEDGTILYRDFENFRSVIATLRGPNGCPWDKMQTHHTLKKYLIEEAYEVLEAIDDEDDNHLVEELGDVLLQVMLHAQIGEDNGFFAIDDVIAAISEKMIRRHPHVFGDATAETSEEVVKNWEEIKKEEKKETNTSLLDDVPKSLPGLLRAYELQKKAAKVGFDWKEVEPILDKVREELAEFEAEVKKGDEVNRKKEFGDLLFALVNVGRFFDIDPELAIQSTNRKFLKRFAYIEERVKNSRENITEMTLDELDRFWEEAKLNEKK
jgi:tetrapyrrole methylase family protein/MazG family protein